MPPEMRAERQVSPARKVTHKRAPAQAIDFEAEPETLCYRRQALAIVRHFFEMSCQLGRLPSILGREFFRAKVSHHAIPSFEEQALFAHDIQQSLMKLNEDEIEVLTVVGLYDLTMLEAAKILHCSEGYISLRFGEALGRLTQVFLDAGLLSRSRPDRQQVQMKRPTMAGAAPPPKKPCTSVRPLASKPAPAPSCSR